ncbi:MAG: DUF4229 domain-containing protein [Nostocoides sp.]
MARYTLLRFLVFFGVLALLALIPPLARDKLLLLVLSAVVSLVVSYVLLKPLRDRATMQLQQRMADRRAADWQPHVSKDSDSTAEDAEIDEDFR